MGSAGEFSQAHFNCEIFWGIKIQKRRNLPLFSTPALILSLMLGGRPHQLGRVGADYSKLVVLIYAPDLELSAAASSASLVAPLSSEYVA